VVIFDGSIHDGFSSGVQVHASGAMSLFPRNAARIIASAQPVPLSTQMAPLGQLFWQAPHSMHLAG